MHDVFECQLCGGQLQATLITEHYFNVMLDGSVKRAEVSGQDTVRVYCENDCDAEPGAVVYTEAQYKAIADRLLELYP